MSEPQSVSSTVAERAPTETPAVNSHLELALLPSQTYWTPKQQAALTALGVPLTAKQEDLAVYFHVCKRTGLDPFMRQIHLIMRRQFIDGSWVQKPTIQVGIDGFRVTRDRVAARTGYECDFEDTVWYDDEGGEHAVWIKDDPPAACRVVLVKHGHGHTLRFPAVLRTKSYMPTKDDKPTGQWATQADHMIEKCCEAFATRRAFPDDLGGLYIEDEMSVSDVIAEQRRNEPGAPPTIAGAVDQNENRGRDRRENRDDIINGIAGLFNNADLAMGDTRFDGARQTLLLVMANPDGERVNVASWNKLTNAQLLTARLTLGNTIVRAREADRDPAEVLLGIARAAGWQDPAATEGNDGE